MGATDSPQIVFDRSADGRAVGFERAVAVPRLAVPVSEARPAGARAVARRTGASIERRVRYDLAQPMRVNVRHTFALVEEFRSPRDPGGRPARGPMLGAILQAAEATFSLAEKVRTDDLPSIADRLRCLQDLEQLLGDLRSNAHVPAHDLAHAMDGLIVHLVRLMQAPPRAGQRNSVAPDV